MDSARTRFRLSTMMFGQYLIMGAWVVTLPTYLMASPLRGGHQFSATAAAAIFSTLAIAGIVTPFVIGLLADRRFSAQRLMTVGHVLGAGLLFAAGWWCDHRQTHAADTYRHEASQLVVDGVPLLEELSRPIDATRECDAEHHRCVEEAIQRLNDSPSVSDGMQETVLPLFLLLLVYSFCNVATITLSNVIAFRNLHDPQHSFGRVRLYGTVGWIAASIWVGLGWEVPSATPFYLAGALSLLFAVFCLSLPPTPPAGKARTWGEAFGLPALGMFRDRSFCIIVVCALATSAVQQFYTIYANRYLQELGTPYHTAVQSLAQVAEALCMLVFPLVLTQLGMKYTLALGLFGWVVRFGVFATLTMPLVVVVGLPLHGLSYSFFFLVASIYMDRKAPPDLRGSVQGIFTFISMGAGTLLGNWFSARIVQQLTAGNAIRWTDVWLIPMGISAVTFLVFVVFFRIPADASEGRGTKAEC